MKTLVPRIVTSAVLLVLAGTSNGCACVNIDSGTRGVLWTAFGGGTQLETYGEGLQMVAAWNKMYVYDIRTLERNEPLHMLTNNGLSVSMDVSVRFRALPEEVVTLHSEIGPDYYLVILAPQIRSVAREVIGRYSPEEIYSTKRDKIEAEIFEMTGTAIAGRHILLEAILIRDIVLPEKIKAAIEDKLDEEQKAKRMEFTLDRERKEAEKRKIAAEGVAVANNILTASITPTLLKWEGIKATKELATSTNAKIVMVGGSASGAGLPLVLGLED